MASSAEMEGRVKVNLRAQASAGRTQPSSGGAQPRVGAARPGVGGAQPQPGVGGAQPQPGVGRVQPQPGVGRVQPQPGVGRAGPRVGRRRSTTRGHIADVAIELFSARGCDAVSADDVAQAAGIARRTLFRYYPSKNAIPWGEFDTHLDRMRELLGSVADDVPTGQALRTALLAFNTFDESETPRHRSRMRVILRTTELQAYSMTMYAGWRAVIAGFVARRCGAEPDDLVPQTAAWTMLAVALSAYEHWLADEAASLPQALGEAFDVVRPGLDALDAR